MPTTTTTPTLAEIAALSPLYSHHTDGPVELVTWEDGQHHITISINQYDGRTMATVELWHDEDPDHTEYDVEIVSLDTARQLDEDPTSLYAE